MRHSYLRREDGLWVAGSVHECDVQLHRDVGAGRDLVGAGASGVELASLCAAAALQVHTLLHRVQTQPLCECSLHLIGECTYSYMPVYNI